MSASNRARTVLRWIPLVVGPALIWGWVAASPDLAPSAAAPAGDRVERGRYLVIDHRLRRLPLAQGHGAERSGRGPDSAALGPPRRRRARGAARAKRIVDRRRLLGPHRLGGAVGHQLPLQPDAGREHRDRQLVGADLRSGDQDRTAHGRFASDPAADAVALLPQPHRGGSGLDLRVSAHHPAGAQPRAAAGAARDGVRGTRPPVE